MWYELKLKVTKTNEKGEEKEVSEEYITNVEFFSQAEVSGMGLYEGCDVTNIQRSNIKEFVSEVAEEGDSLYKATITDVFTDLDSGKERKLKYYVAVWAKDIKSATEKMTEYLKQGFETMNLDSINKTSILDIL